MGSVMNRNAIAAIIFTQAEIVPKDKAAAKAVNPRPKVLAFVAA